MRPRLQVALEVDGAAGSLAPPAGLACPALASDSPDAPPLAVQWLRLHWQYLAHAFQQLPALPEAERQEFGYRERAQAPLQPLAHHLESATYATFERDAPKYEAYADALHHALHERAVLPRPPGPLRVVVAGAGRGPLVDATLMSARALGVAVAVTAVEKNPSAVQLLRKRATLEWGRSVHVVAGDMRTTRLEAPADVLVRASRAAADNCPC